MCDVTEILGRMEAGDQGAADQLLPLVYDELRKLAAARLAQERPGQTLQATALVHEAYLRLVGGNRDMAVDATTGQSAQRQLPSFQSQGHFFAAAAEAMRRILVDNARHKASLKHGGQLQRQTLPELAAEAAMEYAELLALDEALQRLGQVDPQAAEIVKLRFFAGMTMAEIAQVLGIAPRTAYYAWDYARSWLRQELADGTEV